MRIAALALSLAITAPLAAQAEHQPETLRGPRVTAPSRPSTLVERDFSGRVKRLEVPPEEATLPLLGLNAATQSKVDGILAARAQILDKIVADNIDLVVQFANARQAGDRPAQLKLLGDFAQKLQPLNARGKLADELKGVLLPDQTQRMDALVSEYRRVITDEDIADAQTKGERITRLQANLRQNLLSTGLEIRRSYERTIAARGAEFEQILGQLNLRPEQEAKIREMVADFVQETKGKPTPEQRRNVFFKIMAFLDPDQQKALMAAYMGRPSPGL